MVADVTLMNILTGGVYAYASLGRDGLTRDAVSAAFDATTGFLKPLAVVKQRAAVPDGQVVDFGSQDASAVQIVEIWLYEDSSFSNIDAAMSRLFELFYGYQFSDTWELELVGGLDRQVEQGQLLGASMSRMDWQVISVM
jgi:hypothetical protein